MRQTVAQAFNDAQKKQQCAQILVRLSAQLRRYEQRHDADAPELHVHVDGQRIAAAPDVIRELRELLFVEASRRSQEAEQLLERPVRARKR